MSHSTNGDFISAMRRLAATHECSCNCGGSGERFGVICPCCDEHNCPVHYARSYPEKF